MSFKAMAWASKQKTGNSVRKFVLMMLADRCNDSGLCWPSHKTIMSDCEIGSKTTLIKHLKELENDGFIEIISRSKDGVSLPNHYKVKIGTVVQKMNHGSTEYGLGGGTENEHKPINNKPINEPIKKINKKEDLKTKQENIFETVENKTLKGLSKHIEHYPEGSNSRKALLEYEDHIKSLGRQYKKTDRAWKLFVTKADDIRIKFGVDELVNQINRAIEHNWKTVYEPTFNTGKVIRPKATTGNTGVFAQ